MILLVARLSNLKRVLQHPHKHPENPLLTQDRPWEKRYLQIYGTVLYEPDIDKFRMWYMASEREDAAPEMIICLAESKDGIQWSKPHTGSIELPNHPEHNAVLANAHGLSVMKDLRELDPSKRYKGVGGDLLAFSPDGIHWVTETFTAAGQNDTSSSTVFWKGAYHIFLRNQEWWKGTLWDHYRAFVRQKPFFSQTIREVALSTSTDYLHWTPKETILRADSRDGYPWTQPYGLSVTPYGDQLIGLLWFIHLDRIRDNNKIGYQTIQLVVSRDGYHWNRVADRAVFLESSPGEWDRGQVIPGASLLVKDDQIYIYYTGSDIRHGEGWGNMGIGLATLSSDRFLAIVQKDSSTVGILETKLFTSAGDRLLVNAEAAENELRVELIDKDGNVIPGFEKKNSRLIPHDRLRKRAVWEDEYGVRTLKQALKNSQSMALRFYVHGGALFAFQILPDREDVNINPIDSVAFDDSNQTRFISAYQRDLQELEKSIQEDPSNAVLFSRLSLLHAQFGNLNRAIVNLEKAIQLQPSEPILHYNLADLFFRQTHFQAAHNQLAKAIQLNPNEAGFYEISGLASIHIGEFNDAIKDLSKAIELNPDDPYLYCYRGAAYLCLSKTDDALRDCDKALALKPDDDFLYFLCANTHLNSNQFEEAIEKYSIAIERNPQVPLYYTQRGYAYFNLKKYDLGIIDYTKVIESDACDGLAYLRRGILLLKLKDYEKSREDFTRAIELDPDEDNAYFYRGLIHYEKDQYQNAIEDISRAIDRNPVVKYYTVRSDAYLRIKKFDQAITDLNKLITVKPAFAYYNLAGVYSIRSQFQNPKQKQKDITQALQCLQEAIRHGYSDWKEINTDPKIDAIRLDPRFRGLLKR